MHVYSLGEEGRRTDLVILDSNVVNPIVVALSEHQKTRLLIPRDLIRLLSTDTKCIAYWYIGACESYMQRGMVVKSDYLKYCDKLFPYLGTMTGSSLEYLFGSSSKPALREDTKNFDEIYQRIYVEHLYTYCMMLKLFDIKTSRLDSWCDFTRWLSEHDLSINSECHFLIYSVLLRQQEFNYSRIIRLNRDSTGDQVAKSAWRIAWDVMLLSLQCDSKRPSTLITQDSTLSDYFQYLVCSCPTLGKEQPATLRKGETTIATSARLSELVKEQEEKLGVSFYFDAQREFVGGLRNPFC